MTSEESLEYLETSRGSQRSGVYGSGSLDRFAGAAKRVEGWSVESNPDAVTYAFETLAQVAQGRSTRWSIVYELDRGRVHFRTVDRKGIRSLDLAELDFSCATDVRVLDLNADRSGDVAAALVPYTKGANYELIQSSYGKVDFLADVPDAELARLAAVPDTASCRE